MGKGERLSVTHTPGPFPSNLGIEREYNSHNKQCYMPPEGSVVVRIDIKDN
jgi:hypothetical protein